LDVPKERRGSGVDGVAYEPADETLQFLSRRGNGAVSGATEGDAGIREPGNRLGTAALAELAGLAGVERCLLSLRA